MIDNKVKQTGKGVGLVFLAASVLPGCSGSGDGGDGTYLGVQLPSDSTAIHQIKGARTLEFKTEDGQRVRFTNVKDKDEAYENFDKRDYAVVFYDDGKRIFNYNDLREADRNVLRDGYVDSDRHNCTVGRDSTCN